MGSWRLGLIVALGCGCAPAASSGAGAECSVPPAVSHRPEETERDGSGNISGVVQARDTHERIGGALVVLQSSALEAMRETQTNAEGLYVFRDLPPGTYTVQVLYRRIDIAKVTTLPAGAKFRANFTIDPDGDGIVCRFPVSPYSRIDESLLSVDRHEARLRGLVPMRRGL